MEQKEKMEEPSLAYLPQEEVLDMEQPNRLSIGIPKETTFHENRIGLTPGAVEVLVSNGHQVVVEKGAGDGAHFHDNEYADAGAKVVIDRKNVYKAEIIVKSAPVKDDEINFLHEEQILVSPLHLPRLKAEHLQKLIDKKITGLSFEYLQDSSGAYPIVRSMSEIAGSASMLIGGRYLSKASGGRGILLGGVSGVPPATVVIIGAGVVGEYAARAALALGASVHVFDDSIYKLKRLQNNIGLRVYTSVINPLLLAEKLSVADIAIGALSSNTGRTPLVVTEEMVANMRKGSVIVDVSIDRGGCFETSEMTSHAHPTFKKFDVLHYCVPNIPSAYARTASKTISNILMPLLLKAADHGGLENEIWQKRGVRAGIYLYRGSLTNEYLSRRFNLKFTDMELLRAARN